jgi:3-methyladenine DNA glycosylase AlkD
MDAMLNCGLFSNALMKPVINKIRSDLKRNSDARTRNSFKRFFKEEVKFYGVKSAVVHKIARARFAEVRDLGKQEIFGMCEELLRSGYCEESWIAANWAHWVAKEYQPEDFETFERWLNKYIDNWAECDTLCNHAVGAFIEQYPEFIGRLKGWTGSENRWVKRAAAVSLIVPARRGKFLKDVFEIADCLLLDHDDLVQKGYGWLLKEASRKHQSEVHAYVMKNKARMPRTALRYAIEKMPASLRKKAMAK